MVRRRAKAAGIATEVCNHTFRGTGITAHLENGGTLEKARQMAAHASARTTQLYDRREDRVTPGASNHFALMPYSAPGYRRSRRLPDRRPPRMQLW